jgi:hypothetical protein
MTWRWVVGGFIVASIVLAALNAYTGHWLIAVGNLAVAVILTPVIVLQR